MNEIQQATEHFRLCGLRLAKAERNIAKGYTLNRMEERADAKRACERAKQKLRELIMACSG
jgi:hypothetical protein